MSHKKDDKKNKKKAFQLKKTHEAQQIFAIFRMRRTEEDRIEKNAEMRTATPEVSSEGSDRVWSDKLATIRNRIWFVLDHGSHRAPGLQADYDLRVAKRTTWLKAEPRVRVHS